MAMPGVTFQEIRDAIVDAYRVDALEETLTFLMNERLDVITGAGAFGHRVFELVQWAEMHGREVELIQAVAKARPRNPKIQQIYKKYGMAVTVYVEKAGAEAAGAPADVTEGGLEAIVRPHLSFNDFGIWRERMTE